MRRSISWFGGKGMRVKELFWGNNAHLEKKQS
jgi:hypothetical protein